MLFSCSLLALDSRDPHFFIHDPASLDDEVSIELHAAVAHRYVVMAAGRALAAALGVRAGREKEVTGKGARGGTVPFRRVTVKRDAVPERLRIHSPAQMRDGVRIAVLCRALAVLEPVAHELRVHAAFDFNDMAFADFKLDGVGDV